MDAWAAAVLIVLMFAILGAGVWIGIGILGVGWLAMELFTDRLAGDSLALTVWGSMSSWTLTALPLFVWMGEILLKTQAVRGTVSRARAVAAEDPGTAAAREHHRLHDLCCRVRFVGGDLRHRRQDLAA